MATLLDITNGVADEIGLPRPATIIDNSDEDARMLLQLCNRSGRELTKAADWTILTRVHTFSTSDGEDEYSLPSDYSRLLRETEWNRSQARPMRGQVNAQEWQVIKSGLTSGGIVNQRMRIFRASSSTSRSIYIDPEPDSTETIAFEYISSQWLSNAAGDTLYTGWNADTDVLLLDQDILTLFTILRWRRAKGLDWASQADELGNMIEREIGQDRPSPILNLGRQRNIRLLDYYNIPETGLGA